MVSIGSDGGFGRPTSEGGPVVDRVVFWSVGVESMLRFGWFVVGVLVLEVETLRLEKSWLRVEETPKTWSFRWRGSRV